MTNLSITELDFHLSACQTKLKEAKEAHEKAYEAAFFTGRRVLYRSGEDKVDVATITGHSPDYVHLKHDDGTEVVQHRSVIVGGIDMMLKTPEGYRLYIVGRGECEQYTEDFYLLSDDQSPTSLEAEWKVWQQQENRKTTPFWIWIRDYKHIPQPEFGLEMEYTKAEEDGTLKHSPRKA